MGMFVTDVNATEATVQSIVAAAGTVENFFVLVENAPQSGRSWTFILRRNGVSTAVTCTIFGDNLLRTCSDTTNTAAFVAGDLISVRVVAAGLTPTNTVAQWTAQFAP